MLPERNELKVLNEQLADMDEEFELEMDSIYFESMFQSFLKNDGEDHKRMALMDFDVPAHILLVAELNAEKQFGTSSIIQGYLDEYARLFPNR